MYRESAAQVILRTSLRFDKIKHLPKRDIKHLMSLSDKQFEIEFEKYQTCVII